MSKGFIRELVRDEISEIARSSDVFEALIMDAKEIIGSYFGRSRKMSASGFQDLIAQIDQTVVSEIRPVRRKVSIRKPTVTRPKSEATELFYLFATPEDRIGRNTIFRLISLRILATRKKVIMEFVPTHLALREHAAKRFIERGADSSRAVRLLASSVADWAILPSIVDEALDASGHDRLALPCRTNGMLMGCIDPREGIPEGLIYVFDKHGIFSDGIAASPLTPMTYVVNTYIGRAEIKDNQMGAVYLMDEWRRMAGETFDKACEAVFWPVRDLEPIENAEIDESLRERMCEEIVEPRMLRAMGNRVYAPSDDDPRFSLQNDDEAFHGLEPESEEEDMEAEEEAPSFAP